jgi:hypothetical protein
MPPPLQSKMYIPIFTTVRRAEAKHDHIHGRVSHNMIVSAWQSPYNNTALGTLGFLLYTSKFASILGRGKGFLPSPTPSGTAKIQPQLYPSTAGSRPRRQRGRNANVTTHHLVQKYRIREALPPCPHVLFIIIPFVNLQSINLTKRHSINQCNDDD